MPRFTHLSPKVLFLDADNGPVRDVTYLFDTPQFQEHGAIFWPDYACWTLKPEVWHIFGMDWMVPQAQKEIAFESGQYLIDKTRCWRELRMALWYAEHSDFVFRVVYGDKECFHLAWRKLGTEYAMPRKVPGWNQHTIVQYDFQAPPRPGEARHRGGRCSSLGRHAADPVSLPARRRRPRTAPLARSVAGCLLLAST